MPVNPDKQPCQVPGCKAWAMRGANPPLCSAHAGRSRGAGAPPGNHNRLSHGFYAATLHPDEQSDLDTRPENLELDAEIAITRVALRRILAMLLAGTTLGPEPAPLTAAEYARLFSLAFQGARAVARLLTVRHNIVGPSEDLYTSLMNSTLDDLSQEWGISL